MKLIISLFLLAFANSAFADQEAVPEYESTVILKGEYIQDHQMFSTFVFLVTESENYQWVARDLGFNVEEEEDLKDFRKFRKKVKKVDRKLSRSLKRAWFKANCLDSSNVSARTRDRIIDDMDRVEKSQEDITKKHIRRFLKSLDQEMSVNVSNFLKGMKESASVTMISNQDFNQQTSTEQLQSDVATKCVNESGDYYSANGGSNE